MRRWLQGLSLDWLKSPQRTQQMILHLQQHPNCGHTELSMKMLPTSRVLHVGLPKGWLRALWRCWWIHSCAIDREAVPCLTSGSIICVCISALVAATSRSYSMQMTYLNLLLSNLAALQMIVSTAGGVASAAVCRQHGMFDDRPSLAVDATRQSNLERSTQPGHTARPLVQLVQLPACRF